jgi:hypothetical protein
VKEFIMTIIVMIMALVVTNAAFHLLHVETWWIDFSQMNMPLKIHIASLFIALVSGIIYSLYSFAMTARKWK